MRKPRRIFRANRLVRPHPDRRVGFRPLAILAVAAGIAGGAVLLTRQVQVAVAPPSAGLIVAGPAAVAVVDGGTLRLRETVVRLAGVEAPTRGRACRAASGASTDCGRAAADALARLVEGRTVACRLDGRDPHGLPIGNCDAAGDRGGAEDGGGGVNRAIVAAGWARASSGPIDLVPEESDARSARRGMWRDGADISF